MFTLKKNISDAFLDSLLKDDYSDKLLKDVTKLQNEIAIDCLSKVVAITTIDNPKVTLAFSRLYSNAYSVNGLKTLIIDLNSNQSFLDLLFNQNVDRIIPETFNSKNGCSFVSVDDKTQLVSFAGERYFSELLKTGIVENIINDNNSLFDHFIILMPPIAYNKEILLLSNVLTAVVLVVQKNITKKEDVFNAIQFFKQHSLPLIKTIILK